MTTNKATESIPRVILGTMTFGQQVSEADAERMVGMFLDAGLRQIDTAHIYSKGRSEEILGGILAGRDRESFHVATKAHPSVTGHLSPESVTDQLETSLKRLRLDFADLLYLHQPDLETPIEKTLEACARLHERGLFRELGLSNYAAWQVADICRICERQGRPSPTVYQGMYNAVTRDVERELFPCLRAFGLRFHAYNPLAGGVLSGKYAWQAQPPVEGRFHEYVFYVDRYWNESYVRAAETAGAACEQHGIALPAAALRWLAHHSLMSGEQSDGTIIGASRVAHAEQNLSACADEPLPQEVVDAFDLAWEAVRPYCPKYLRP